MDVFDCNLMVEEWGMDDLKFVFIVFGDVENFMIIDVIDMFMFLDGFFEVEVFMDEECVMIVEWIN